MFSGPVLSTMSVGVFCIALNANAAPGIAYDVVALSGSTGTARGLGPGAGEGYDFGFFQAPVINADGVVAFGAVVNGSTSGYGGLYTGVSGDLKTVADTRSDGLLGPSQGSGVFFEEFRNLALNDSGDVAFIARLAGAGVSSSNKSGIWTNSGGALRTVARPGLNGTDPGVGEGAYFRNVGSFALNNQGKVSFAGYVSDPNLTVRSAAGVWMDNAGVLSKVAQVGDSVSDLRFGASAEFSAMVYSPALNAHGDLAYLGFVDLDGGLFSDETAVFGVQDAATEAVAGSGTYGPLPAPLGSEFDFVGFYGDLGINNAGQVAFRADAQSFETGQSQSLWVASGESLAIVAGRETDGALGPQLGDGVYFDNVGNSSIVLNAAGEIVVRASIIGNGITNLNNTGIWIVSEAGNRPIAQRRAEGQLGPGLGPGVSFDNLNAGLESINAEGEVLFPAILTGPGIDYGNDFGLWANFGDSLVTIVREGDVIDVDPGPGADLRTVKAVRYGDYASGGEDGLGRPLNDDGLVAFAVRFTDGSEGVFTASLEGDFDSSGAVDQSDLDLVLLNWGVELSSLAAPNWRLQRPDGFVGQAELDRVLLNWGTAASPAVVPEPLGGLCILSVVALRYRVSRPYVRQLQAP